MASNALHLCVENRLQRRLPTTQAAQYEQLARIGFGAPPSWAGMIDELKNYKIIHGDADVPPDYVTERGKLATDSASHVHGGHFATTQAQEPS